MFWARNLVASGEMPTVSGGYLGAQSWTHSTLLSFLAWFTVPRGNSSLGTLKSTGPFCVTQPFSERLHVHLITRMK